MVCWQDVEGPSCAQRLRKLNRVVGAWDCSGDAHWDVAPVWYEPGLWPAPLRDEGRRRLCTCKSSKLQARESQSHKPPKLCKGVTTLAVKRSVSTLERALFGDVHACVCSGPNTLKGGHRACVKALKR